MSRDAKFSSVLNIAFLSNNAGLTRKIVYGKVILTAINKPVLIFNTLSHTSQI